MQYDPLLSFENNNPHHPHTPRQRHRFLRWARTFVTYIALTGCIFAVLISLLNFSAYSARITNWMNPAILENISSNMRWALTQSSIEVHAAAESESEIESKIAIEQKVAATDPSLVYSRSYTPDRLLASIDSTSEDQAHFSVTPYENRIIIPKIGKNIPLIDVDHAVTTDMKFTDMHDIFMDELKDGVVRYPGTARPGEVGNVFIFGHSSNFPWIKSEYNDVFALLDELKTGDDIIVYYNQRKYVYKVTDRTKVKPGDVDALNARDPSKKEISLMTCWPVGTTLDRLIIFGELQDAS